MMFVVPTYIHVLSSKHDAVACGGGIDESSMPSCENSCCGVVSKRASSCSDNQQNKNNNKYYGRCQNHQTRMMQQKQRKKRGVVRFALAENKYIEPGVILTYEDAIAMWWSPDEQNVIRRNGKKITKKAKKQQHHHDNNDSNSTTVRDIIHRIHYACSYGMENTICTMTESMIFCRGDLRGLERFIYREISKDRRYAVCTVLKMQQATMNSRRTRRNNINDSNSVTISRIKDDHITKSEQQQQQQQREIQIAMKYREQSSTSRRLAQVLAAGDALVAKEINNNNKEDNRTTNNTTIPCVINRERAS